MLDKEVIGGFTLNYDFYSGTDFYSDGDIEDELLRVCKEGRISEELEQGNSWPMLYHLSKVRESLLEWYEFEEGASVLEIGSGCGGITGLLTEKAEKVVCIELSRRRSLINANKNGKRGSAQIYVGNFQDIVIEDKFDYVTLIGVLEYSKLYIGGERPFHKILEKIKGYLKPNGKVIIAIENKMGMKYFSGAAEDHTGRPYDGLNNYTCNTSAVTFSKPELEKILTESGFDKLQFYYPMPDYKLPSVIYSDEYLPSVGELRGIKKAYAGMNFQTFDEEMVYDNVCKDGSFPYFANSFLVIADKM